MCEADISTYIDALYFCNRWQMSLIDCISAVDSIVQQRCYFHMLFTIHHHRVSVPVETLHISFWYTGYQSSFLFIWGPACFLLPGKAVCLLDTFWLLTWCAKMLTSLGNLLLHSNRFCNNLWYFIINWPVLLGCWAFVPVLHVYYSFVIVACTGFVCSMFHFHFCVFHYFCILLLLPPPPPLLLLLLPPLPLPPPPPPPRRWRWRHKFKIICRIYRSHLWITLNDSVDVIR